MSKLTQCVDFETDCAKSVLRKGGITRRQLRGKTTLSGFASTVGRDIKAVERCSTGQRRRLSSQFACAGGTLVWASDGTFRLAEKQDDDRLLLGFTELRFDGGLIDQHDRDVVLNRVDPAALRAFQTFRFLAVFERLLARRTDQYFS